jgi:thiamine kinase-like enzyme
LDFEYLCDGPIAFDLANHFAEYSWSGTFDNLRFRRERLPTPEAQQRFAEGYLEARGAACAGVTVYALLEQCVACERVSHYHWCLWGVLNGWHRWQGRRQGGGFDYLEYARERFVAMQEAPAVSNG